MRAKVWPLCELEETGFLGRWAMGEYTGLVRATGGGLVEGRVGIRMRILLRCNDSKGEGAGARERMRRRVRSNGKTRGEGFPIGKYGVCRCGWYYSRDTLCMAVAAGYPWHDLGLPLLLYLCLCFHEAI